MIWRSQNFLGPTPAAKNFTDRYLSHRFPRLAPPSVPTPTLNPNPKNDVVPLKPKGSKSKGGSNVGTPSSGTPKPGPPTGIPEALQAAFGPGGKVYQKNRDSDDASAWKGGSATGSGSASGSHTPSTAQNVSFRQAAPLRVGGAVTVLEGKGRARIDQSGGQGQGQGQGRKGKDKDVERIWDLPKSKEVRRLEGIMGDLRNLQAGEGKVASDGMKTPDCFCQGMFQSTGCYELTTPLSPARVHPLSSYTPHCSHCGLIVCALHAPHLPCPSCAQPLLSPAQLARLLLRVQSEIDAQLALEQAEREETERERLARLAAESGGGAFPILPGGAHSRHTSGEQGRKVLTLGGKAGKGRATLTTTFTRSTPTGPTTPPLPTDIVPRPRSPPFEVGRIEKELSKVLAWRVEVDRPWGDLRADKKGEGWKYVEVVVPQSIMEDSEGRRKAARKKKPAKGVGVGGRVVPGAAG